MDSFIDQIRAAVAADATDDTHQAGASACRSILAALDAKQAARDVSSAPSASAPPPPATTPPPAVRPRAAAPTTPAPRSVGDLPALVAIRAVPRGQILDYVIDKLRALQPEAQTGPAAFTSAIGALRNLSLDQVVDLGVAKLHTALARPAARHVPALPDGTRVIHLAPHPRAR